MDLSSTEKSVHKRIDGVNMVEKIKREKREALLKDCCWIC